MNLLAGKENLKQIKDALLETYISNAVGKAICDSFGGISCMIEGSIS